ncbi:hypothetical protein G3M48_003384 [Beauveria asiatica]|uniref:Transglycosylase SLT domain-containing protein n=1 Tax=Beauveria asiatica TaxID=1069075 RepID=A0AAW0RVD0_9HYPO
MVSKIRNDGRHSKHKDHLKHNAGTASEEAARRRVLDSLRRRRSIFLQKGAQVSIEGCSGLLRRPAQDRAPANSGQEQADSLGTASSVPSVPLPYAHDSLGVNLANWFVMGTSCVCSGTECSIILTTNSNTKASALPSSQQDPGSSAPSKTSSLSGSQPSSDPEQGGYYVRTFLGNGSYGWPELAQWTNFESIMEVKSAIEKVANSSGVDERFILAVALQESGCCVRASTTNNGVNNPGIMQSHNGNHSYGVTGTASGYGLKQILGSSGSDVSRYYKAARIYNSGSIASSGLLEDGGATHCYASDIANRLIGWSRGPTRCKIS